jgi:hypothetical protein
MTELIKNLQDALQKMEKEGNIRGIAILQKAIQQAQNASFNLKRE